MLITSAHVIYTNRKNKKRKKGKTKYKIKSQRLSNENENYAYFRKSVKSTSVILCYKTTKGTEVYTCWQGIPHNNNSFGKKNL